MFDQIADVVPAIHKKGVELRGRGVALDGLSRSSEIISRLRGLPHSPFLTVKWLAASFAAASNQAQGHNQK